MRKFLPLAVMTGIMLNPFTAAYIKNDLYASFNMNEYELASETDDASNSTHTYGYVANEWDNNAPVYESDFSLYNEIPYRFPDDMSVFKNTYPVTRDQNPYGSCWAFASLGLAEFDLINDGNADSSIDLSELQLIYFLFNSVTDPLGGTEGDFAYYYNANASTSYLNYGGNYEMASRRLSQWIGGIPEAEVPYSNASMVLSNGLDSKYAYNYNVAHLRNVYRISLRHNADDVKQQIMEHGAVGVMYYHNDFNLSSASDGTVYNYYDTAASGGGHAVMIVGWDDTYSRNNFAWAQPANDGAWLIRNSWGNYIDYFWMSYETASLQDTAWVFDFEASDEYDNNYQLDGGLETYSVSYTTMANVFTAKNDNEVKSETLKAVSLSTSMSTNVNYTIEVYTDLTDEKNPLSGTKQESATTQGTTAYAGRYTIELNNEVKIVPGSRFAIVVSVDKPALDCEQATCIANGENFSNMIWERRVSLNDGKTFYKYGDKFYAYPSNLRVKAFTTDDENTSNIPDVPETPSEPDVPDVPETPSKPDNPDVPDVPETPSEPDVPDEPETPSKPDNPDIPDVPETPSEPDNPDVPEVPDVPSEPDIPDAPETPSEPDVPDVPDTPDVPATPDIQELPSYTIGELDYSPVFNANYYYLHNADLANAFGKDAQALFNHFISYGIYEGRQACESFNPLNYRNNYRDLDAAFGEDLSAYYAHYIKYGKAEGRSGVNINTPDTVPDYTPDVKPNYDYVIDGIDYSVVFDADYYYNTHRDVANAFGKDNKALFNHFMTYGIYEGRQANIEFNVEAYKERYRDLSETFGSDIRTYYIHYILYGKAEGRSAVGGSGYIYDGIDYSAVFDSGYYHDHYGDLANAFGSDSVALFEHFVKYGMDEGRQASTGFNVYTYMNRYRDLNAAYGSDLKMYYQHYIKYGISEGRSAQ